jgi:ankyrin repeat protein
VKFLIEVGFSKDIPDEVGNSPLHVAAANGFHDIAAFLVENGSDTSLLNKEGFAPVTLAAQVLFAPHPISKSSLSDLPLHLFRQTI